MQPKEIVRRAINHENPPRLPVRFTHFGVDDTTWVGPKAPAGWEPPREGEDEWGCVWSQTEMKNMGQVKKRPLEHLSDLADFSPPDYTIDSRFDDVEDQLEAAETEGQYVVSGIFMVLFERMHSLHGFANVLTDLYANRSAMEQMADMIADTHVTLVEEMAKRFPGRIDGWSMTDDWGTQQAAFVSYEMWMDFFFPRYKRIFDAMHGAGCDVWVHSCGKINEIIEGYIQAGVDVVNLQQPRALGIEAIGERYQGRISFESLADIQSSLPTGDWARIEDDAEALMTEWASPDGGFVFSDYGEGAAIGVEEPGTKEHMYDVFSRWSERIYGNPLPPRQEPADAGEQDG